MRSERNNSLTLQKNKIMEEEKAIQDLNKEDIELLLDSFEFIYTTKHPRYKTLIPDPGNIVMFIKDDIEYVGLIKTNYKKDGYISADLNIWYREEKTNEIVTSEIRWNSGTDMFLSYRYVFDNLVIVFEDIDDFKSHIKLSRKRGWISDGSLNIMYDTIIDLQEEMLDLHKKIDNVIKNQNDIIWRIKNFEG